MSEFASHEASILNTSVTGESPDIVEQEDIQNILKFIKEYKEDEKLQLSDENLRTNFQPKGISAWAAVPLYITRRIRDRIWDLDDKDIPTSADLAKSLNPAGVDKRSVDYDEFMVIHSNFPESIQNLYNPQVLWEKLISEADAHGRILISAFHEVYAAKCDLLRCRMGLESFSYEKPGYLSFEVCFFFVAIAILYIPYFRNFWFILKLWLIVIIWGLVKDMLQISLLKYFLKLFSSRLLDHKKILQKLPIFWYRVL
jgi:hypothetical protein